jgi:uncharacterized protein YcsI (UPF0317 family)
MSDLEQPNDSPYHIRLKIRKEIFNGVTSGIAPGYVQANLAIVPKAFAFDFLLYCQRNPKPCPILEVLEPGITSPSLTCANADIRYDVPSYNIYRNGRLSESCRNLSNSWSTELVSFLIGCSFSFETAMKDAYIPLRHQELGCNVPMFITSIPTTPAGIFSGPLVVSMRPVNRGLISKAVQVTSRFPDTHGAPIHIGSPLSIGINDIYKPDFGDPVPVRSDEEPVFWACGVTPQAVAIQSSLPLMITHSPGHMLITDKRDSDYAVI